MNLANFIISGKSEDLTKIRDFAKSTIDKKYKNDPIEIKQYRLDDFLKRVWDLRYQYQMNRKSFPAFIPSVNI